MGIHALVSRIPKEDGGVAQTLNITYVDYILLCRILLYMSLNSCDAKLANSGDHWILKL